MNKKLKFVCLSLFVLISAGNACAQESMFQDLSYPYLEKLIATAKKNYPQMKILQDQVDVAESTFHQSAFTWFDGFSASYIYSPESAVNLTQPVIFKGYQLVATINLGTLFEKPYTIHNARIAVNCTGATRSIQFKYRLKYIAILFCLPGSTSRPE